MLLKWLLNHFLFAGTLFFAAGAPALTDTGAGPAGETGGGDSSGDETAAGDIGYDGDAAADDVPLEGADETKSEVVASKEEPEISEFKGLVGQRLVALKKQAPELAQVFQKYPKVQEQIEAVFRREAALRDVFPTVAEARQMRETFPNGLADVQTLQESVQQLEALDKDFYTRDVEGNYAGHAQLLNNMFTDDREATVNLFKTLPKEWARLDRDSYNEVMGQIVGATLIQKGIPEYISDLVDSAKEAKQDGLANSLGKLLNWANGYTKEKPQPSPEEQRLSQDRAKFSRETQQRAQADAQQFARSYVAESKKLQLDIINKHPAMVRLANVKTITEGKRAEIAEKIRANTEKFLGKSPSFMKKLTPAFHGRNLQETISLQKAAWSQQWLLNKMVRDVLRVETPAMIEGNRESVRRRTGAPPSKAPVKTSSQVTPKGPRQVGGIWYKPDGSRFTTAEILAGKHQQA